MEDEKKKKRNKKKKNKQNKASEDDAPPAAVASADHTSNGGNHHHDLQLNSDANAVSDAQRENGFDEAVMREEISRLREEKESHLGKEAGLEEKIRELQDRNDSHVQKQADFEEKICLLSIEKVSNLQKEADLETKISQSQREKGLWLEKENALNETIAKQNIVITRLRMQIVELEENKDNLSKENQLLVKRQSDLQSRIRSLETSLTSAVTDSRKDPSDQNDLNSQIEAAHALVNNLVAENAELVEKMNELYVKLDQKTTEPDRSSSSVESDDGLVRNAELVATESVKDKGMLASVVEVERSVAPVPVRPETDSEIVQVLVDDDIEIKEDFEQQTVERDDHDEDVPLTDSPLIGAPFRLFSFVASYVSGADLVSRS